MTTVIASELAARGWKVCILSLEGGETSAFPLHPSVALASLHMEGRSANFSDLVIWYRLRRFLRERSIEVQIDVDVILSWFSIPSSWRLPVQVISWEHFHCRINVGDLGQRLRRRLGRWVAIRGAFAVITLTERDRKQYVCMSADVSKVHTIPNPVTIQPLPQVQGHYKIVLAAGRLVPQKGFDLLLDAWAQLGEEILGWMLRIVGNGPEEALLRKKVKELGIDESVDFAGGISNMAAEYAAASLYVMSSRFEGLPLVLIEAKSSGLPIVSLDCDCGPSDIVRHGIDGDLVDAGDVDGLASAIRKLVLDPPLLERYGINARQDTRFGLEPVIKQWEFLLGGAGCGR